MNRLPDVYWTTKYGRELKISDMKDSHLNNAINMIKRGTDWEGDVVGVDTKRMLPYLLAEQERRKILSIDFEKVEAQVAAQKVENKKKWDYVDVRFAETPNKVYTYKVRKGAKCYLGQTLVVTNEYKGTSVVFVVGINTPGKTGSVEITEKVVKL